MKRCCSAGNFFCVIIASLTEGLMKKIISILLCVLFIFSVSGCGSDAIEWHDFVLPDEPGTGELYI